MGMSVMGILYFNNPKDERFKFIFLEVLNSSLKLITSTAFIIVRRELEMDNSLVRTSQHGFLNLEI
ncbi:MAG: hypothetical protein ACRDFC_06470 [Ignavibacteria bacterium]